MKTLSLMTTISITKIKVNLSIKTKMSKIQTKKSLRLKCKDLLKSQIILISQLLKAIKERESQQVFLKLFQLNKKTKKTNKKMQRKRMI